MNSFPESFETFLDEQWYAPNKGAIPRAPTYWSLLTRWAWRQGPPESPEEARALSWARSHYQKRYGADPAPLETGIGAAPQKPKNEPPPPPKHRPIPTVPTNPQARRPALVF